SQICFLARHRPQTRVGIQANTFSKKVILSYRFSGERPAYQIKLSAANGKSIDPVSTCFQGVFATEPDMEKAEGKSALANETAFAGGGAHLDGYRPVQLWRAEQGLAGAEQRHPRPHLLADVAGRLHQRVEVVQAAQAMDEPRVAQLEDFRR